MGPYISIYLCIIFQNLSTDQEGNGVARQVHVGIREREGHRDGVQVQPQDSGEDVQVGDDKQGHGEEGVPAGGPHRDTLLHAGRRPHQRPLDHVPEALSNPSRLHQHPVSDQLTSNYRNVTTYPVRTYRPLNGCIRS